MCFLVLEGVVLSHELWLAGVEFNGGCVKAGVGLAYLLVQASMPLTYFNQNCVRDWMSEETPIPQHM